MTSKASSYRLSGFINAADIKPPLHCCTRCVCRLMFCALCALLPSQSQADDFDNLAQKCAPSVAADTLRALVKTESSFNPYAIGVVGGESFMPKSFHEAMAKIAELETEDKNYSVGLAQINKGNFAKYGIDAQKALDACTNLRVAARILGACFTQAQKSGVSQEKALHDALSCYYSGNFKTGYRSGYVNSVRQNAGLPAQVPSITHPTNPADKTASSLAASQTDSRRGLIF